MQRPVHEDLALRVKLPPDFKVNFFEMLPAEGQQLGHLAAAAVALEGVLELDVLRQTRLGGLVGAPSDQVLVHYS